MGREQDVIESVGARYFASESTMDDAVIAEIVRDLPRQQTILRLLDFAAQADRGSPSGAPENSRAIQEALIRIVFDEPVADELLAVFDELPIGIAFSSRAAMHLALIVLTVGKDETQQSSEPGDLNRLGLAMMRLDHRWSVEGASQEARLRAFQMFLFHGTGQHMFTEETAWELFTQVLPLRPDPPVAPVAFSKFDDLVGRAFGFGIADSIAIAHIFGNLAYEKAGLLVIDPTQLNMVCVDEECQITAREFECSRWLDHYSITIGDAVDCARADLAERSGFAFSAFYDRPFLKLSRTKMAASRIDWVQRLASPEAIFKLCRDAMEWHLAREEPDRGALEVRMRSASQLWREHYGFLLQDYVVRMLQSCRVEGVWEERDVPGLEGYDGPVCDVVVETALGVLLLEVKAAIPSFREATRLDAPFLPYLKRISIGNERSGDLKEQQSPLAQIEGTLLKMKCGIGKPRFGLVVTGSKVTLARGHLEDINGLWRQMERPDEQTAVLMVEHPACPIDLAGLYLLAWMSQAGNVDLSSIVYDWYHLAVKGETYTLSALDYIKIEGSSVLRQTPACGQIEAEVKRFDLRSRCA